MPSALYAISYKSTRSVLALCSFEKRDLVDQPTRDALLAALVGAALPVAISGGPPIEVDASKLGCDSVAPLSSLDLEPVLADPYGSRVSIEPAGPAVEPGDGKDKVLKPCRFAVASIDLVSGLEQSATVTLQRPVLVDVTAQLLFEGREPAFADAKAGTKQFVFALPGSPTINDEVAYGVVFLMEDARVEARAVTAASPPSPATLIVGPDAPVPAPTPAKPTR